MVRFIFHTHRVEYLAQEGKLLAFLFWLYSLYQRRAFVQHVLQVSHICKSNILLGQWMSNCALNIMQINCHWCRMLPLLSVCPTFYPLHICFTSQVSTFLFCEEFKQARLYLLLGMAYSIYMNLVPLCSKFDQWLCFHQMLNEQSRLLLVLPHSLFLHPCVMIR